MRRSATAKRCGKKRPKTIDANCRLFSCTSDNRPGNTLRRQWRPGSQFVFEIFICMCVCVYVCVCIGEYCMCDGDGGDDDS